jgi:hypothetical protein
MLVPEQFGIRQGKPTESVNQKMHVGGIFCDLTKAFDCVNPEILLAKLHYYGTQGTVAN